ncbi:hypothetical protein L218DRAFT_909322 [Marasmius fiardii PR-910]|nr:hypothetical protein L218DRAFT_909322 [Marasmius fiardii PR-910]
MVANPFDTVTAQITYVVPPPDGVQPYQLVDYESGKLKEGNVTPSTHDIVIENIRGREHLYTLDDTGFQYLHRPTQCKDFSDPEQLEDYGRESTEIVKGITGAKRVILYSSLQRRRPTVSDDEPLKIRKPAGQVHIDVSSSSAIGRLKQHVPKDEPELLQSRRWGIVNLWRPINIAYDWPLACCNWNSIDPGYDAFPVPRLRPGPEGGDGQDDGKGTVEYNEALSVRFSPNHQWKYIRAMTPDDCVLLKNYDTDDSVARFTPHTAFQDPTTPEGSPPRESIEQRFLCFYD